MNNCVTRMDQFEIIWILVTVIGALIGGVVSFFMRDLFLEGGGGQPPIWE